MYFQKNIVTLETSEGYVSILGEDISVRTLCDERIELTGELFRCGIYTFRQTVCKARRREKSRRKIVRSTKEGQVRQGGREKRKSEEL